MPFRLQKIRAEGSSDPFVARIRFGILELRDQAFRVSRQDLDAARVEFDGRFGPVLDALDALRNSNDAIQKLVGEHRSRVQSGAIVSFQRDTLVLSEAINGSLGSECQHLLNASVRAMKRLQPVAEMFNVRIGCVFTKDVKFEKGLLNLDGEGHHPLAAYLRQVRSAWSAGLIARRDVMEHEGWMLPAVDYSVCGRVVTMMEPAVDGVVLSRFAEQTTRRVIGFVEDLTVYAISRELPPPMVLVEVPTGARNPSLPIRFQLGLACGPAPAWCLQYDERGFC